MAKFITASICLDDLIEKVKAGHSAFTRGKNGKIYIAVKIWENDEKDKYGNDISLQLNSSKEKSEAEGKFYIGNGRIQSSGIGQPIPAGEFQTNYTDDLPF